MQQGGTTQSSLPLRVDPWDNPWLGLSQAPSAIRPAHPRV